MALAIEMSKKKAEILISDGSRLSGYFFVLLHTQGRLGAECLLDLVLDERSFLPFEKDDGQIFLIQKGSIVLVISEGCEYLKGVPYQKKMASRICLLSGQTLEAKVYSDLPQSRSRLSDFLNHSANFFCVEVDGKEYLVNTRFIKSVEPI
jgi:hypothetical protein